VVGCASKVNMANSDKEIINKEDNGT
jgi:hypothetical protein